MKLLPRSYKTRRSIAGWLFVAPWVIGALVFFIQPLIQTIIFSVSIVSPDLETRPIPTGMFQNYIDAFTKDPNFLWYFKDEIGVMLYAVPLIIVFSMFIANILTKKFFGRIFMRAIFFLPVIITTGIIIDLIRTSLTSVSMGDNAGGNLFNNQMLIDFLLNSGFPQGVVNTIASLISNIIDLVWKSGVQILVFMAGILSVPVTYYEVASVEGATGWESFWKITFPLIIPHAMINLIYTMVDLLSSYDNGLMRYIINGFYKSLDFANASALSWIYFLVVMAFIGLALFLIWLVQSMSAKSRQRNSKIY